MRFSIIIPVYNVEKYLAKCIDSVINQEYQDYEIIIVDDGSTDKSYEIALRYQKQYSEKIHLIQQENRGLGGARNTGIENAVGDYLFFVDSDDYIDSNSLLILSNAIDLYHSDIIMFNFCTITTEDKVIWQHDYEEYKNNCRLADYSELLIKTPSACNKIFSRRLFEEVRFPEKQLYEDFAIYAILLEKAKSISMIKDNLYYYVKRNGSIMTGAANRRFKEIIVGLDNIISYYRKMGLLEKYIDEFRYMAVTHVCIYRVLPLLYQDYRDKDMRDMVEYINNNLGCWYKNKYMDKQYPHERKVMKKIYEKKYLELYLKQKIKSII